MVRLKEEEREATEAGRAYFNSTMVRLKVRKKSIIKFNIVTFQFHYGSVKRPQAYISDNATNTFQFHYGSVKSNNYCKTYYKLIEISIPLWFG